LSELSSPFTSCSYPFTGNINCDSLSRFFETKLEKKKADILGPFTGKKMVFALDDIHLSLVDEYGVQSPLELLRQVMDKGGFYDASKLYFKKVNNTQFIASSCKS
jgi:dynein heavy chain